MRLRENFGAKLRRKAKYLRWDINHFWGLDEKFYREARGCQILIYHGICLNDHTRFRPVFLRRKTFEQHLQFYTRYFNLVSLDDYYQGNFSNDKFNICITFDDGYSNNHKYVLPLLKKYKLPATFFITAIRDAGHEILWNDFLGMISKYGPKQIDYKNEHFYKGQYNQYISKNSGISLNEILRSGGFDIKDEMMKFLYPLTPYRENQKNDDYWLQMTVEQIKELSTCPLVKIGSHGYYHNDLAQIPLADAISEMTRSKQFLENVVNKPVNSLAFPYGTYTREVTEEAKKAGYDQLLAMDFHFPEDYTDTVFRERFTVNPFISPANQMHATITRAND